MKATCFRRKSQQRRPLNTDVTGATQMLAAGQNVFWPILAILNTDVTEADVWRLVRKSSQQLFTLVTARVKICGGVS